MSLLTAILATFTALTLLAALRSLRGTTLAAPLIWAIFASMALGGVELAATWSGHAAWLPHLRFLAAGATFCPLMALLGAKRPQDRGWQFVVFSLWGLVAFYGLTELAYRPHRPPEVHWVVRWLLIAPMVTMGLGNHVPTRYWLPAVLIAIGQVVLLSPQVLQIRSLLPESPAVGQRARDVAALAGIALFAAALAVTLFIARARVFAGVYADHPGPTRPTPPSLAGRASADPAFDRVWLDFRDAFGTFWGLRVAARFNQSAEQLGWPVRLTWSGVAVTDTAARDRAKTSDPHLAIAMRQVLESLLRRFVDADWLARRWSDLELPGCSARQHGQTAGYADCEGMPDAASREIPTKA